MKSNQHKGEPGEEKDGEHNTSIFVDARVGEISRIVQSLMAPLIAASALKPGVYYIISDDKLPPSVEDAAYEENVPEKKVPLRSILVDDRH